MHILTHTHTDTHTHMHTHTHTQIHMCTPRTHTQRYMCTLTQDCSILSVVAASHVQSCSQWELYMVSRCMKVSAHQFSKPSFKMVSYRSQEVKAHLTEPVNRYGTVRVQLQTAYWVCSQILPMQQKGMVWNQTNMLLFSFPDHS